jgi:hypothetical protein
MYVRMAGQAEMTRRLGMDWGREDQGEEKSWILRTKWSMMRRADSPTSWLPSTSK